MVEVRDRALTPCPTVMYDPSVEFDASTTIAPAAGEVRDGEVAEEVDDCALELGGVVDILDELVELVLDDIGSPDDVGEALLEAKDDPDVLEVEGTLDAVILVLDVVDKVDEK